MMAPLSDRAALRAAAEWFALLRGPEASAHRARFEDWLGACEEHRIAYNRVAETFSLGKNLAPAPQPVSPSEVIAPRRREPRRGVIAAMAGILALALSIGFLRGPAWLTRHQPRAAVETQRVATRTGEIRILHLADGSIVTLDTDTSLREDFSTGRRDLWLTAGRARFDVAHERRPFVVHAGDGTVTAHGTLFDVSVDAGHASVRLLRGVIDVAVPAHLARRSQDRRLVPGEAVAFSFHDGVTLPSSALKAQLTQPSWPRALLDFDRITLGDLVAEANRYSTTKLIAGTPAIAQTSVSGTFRVGDPERLGEHLAMLLDLDVTHSPNGEIVLTPRRR